MIVELGPGAGALTDPLVQTYGADRLHCIEIDARSVALLRERHPHLTVQHADVLQVDYPQLSAEQQQQQPLTVIGNLPYYITSQILFCLADAAAHVGAVRSATVTMQWEVGQRLVAPTRCKDYGILSVVFQLYTSSVRCHFKIPPDRLLPGTQGRFRLVGLALFGSGRAAAAPRGSGTHRFAPRRDGHLSAAPQDGAQQFAKDAAVFVARWTRTPCGTSWRRRRGPCRRWCGPRPRRATPLPSSRPCRTTGPRSDRKN